MKKIMIIATGMVMIAFAGYSQEETGNSDVIAVSYKATPAKERRMERREMRRLEGNEINQETQAQFATDFDGAPTPAWARGDYYDEASFTNDDGQVEIAFYDYSSKLVGTTTMVNFSDIPANAQKFINEKYGDCDKVAVVYYDDNQANDDDMILYNQSIEKDSYFVQLRKDGKDIVLRVDTDGGVNYFATL